MSADEINEDLADHCEVHHGTNYPLTVTCAWCGESIVSGSLHVHNYGYWQGEKQDWRMHEECYTYADLDGALSAGFTLYEGSRPEVGSGTDSSHAERTGEWARARRKDPNPQVETHPQRIADFNVGWESARAAIIWGCSTESVREEYERALKAFVRVTREPQLRTSTADQRVGEWGPIETAPKDGGHVMLWCVDLVGGNGRVATGSWHDSYNGSWWDFNMEYTVNPTHWMPLPPAPQET